MSLLAALLKICCGGSQSPEQTEQQAPPAKPQTQQPQAHPQPEAHAPAPQGQGQGGHKQQHHKKPHHPAGEHKPPAPVQQPVQQEEYPPLGSPSPPQQEGGWQEVKSEHKPHHAHSPSPPQHSPSPPPHRPEHPGRIHSDQNQINQHDAHYMKLRADANAEGDKMARCFAESHEAYGRGDGAGAKQLSNEGKEHQAKMNALNKEASDWIFVENNKDSKPGEIDLHGLYVKEAIEHTDRALQEAKQRGDSELHLIVGKGLHSQGHVAKIKPAIEELMQKHELFAELDPHNAGVLICKLDQQQGGVGVDEIARRLERDEEQCTIIGHVTAPIPFSLPRTHSLTLAAPTRATTAPGPTTVSRQAPSSSSPTATRSPIAPQTTPVSSKAAGGMSFPFGYEKGSHLPDKCPDGQFCPDEADACQDLLPVDSPCQLNRDDECAPPPNAAELKDTTNRGLNVNGAVCLNNVCMWANATAGQTCVVENTGYIAYGASGEFIDIVSRGNCVVGLYCDAPTKQCMQEKAFGAACTADKECSSWNCLAGGTCGVDTSVPNHVGTWVYAVVAVGIIGGIFGTLFGLFLLHRRQRDQEREKRMQYWREQNAFHQNLLQMRQTARASILSLPNNGNSARSTLYGRDGMPSDEAPILQHAAPKGSGLRHYVGDDSSEYDEGMMMQPTQRNDGRF
ncbi:Smr domain-containing protein [Mycena venus]|uniref:Smr domain-containing protein n=1 Tax=Mycena venus TaxID=2733690 RepID=A0A8H7D4J6_9AGAR|nr:Smr domain-containing protein [Mycena venus]